MSTQRGAIRQYWVALRLLAIFTLGLGIAYPFAVTAIGSVAFPAHASGSLVDSQGSVVGSALIGQSFTDADGAALPEWFQSRPSATGSDGGGSAGSNLGPKSADLAKSIAERRAAVAELEGVDPSAVPADAVTASASGIDPDISPAYARLQVARVARATGLDESDVAELVESRISSGGLLAEPTVNVLELNLALAGLDGR